MFHYSIMCPEKEVLGEMSILTIMSKVRLEAFMWGAGTALGKPSLSLSYDRYDSTSAIGKVGKMKNIIV